MAFTGSTPDLGMQVLSQLFINGWRLLASTRENAPCAFKQRMFPLRKHRRVDPETAGQIAAHLIAVQCFQRDLGCELSGMLRQCPNVGGSSVG